MFIDCSASTFVDLFPKGRPVSFYLLLVANPVSSSGMLSRLWLNSTKWFEMKGQEMFLFQNVPVYSMNFEIPILSLPVLCLAPF